MPAGRCGAGDRTCGDILDVDLDRHQGQTRRHVRRPFLIHEPLLTAAVTEAPRKLNDRHLKG